MQTFHCDHCQALLFFESTQCLTCGHVLAFLPDLNRIAALEQSDGDQWRRVGDRPDGPAYRLCANYSGAQVCNWALRAGEPQPLCISCRLTTVIPNLEVAGHQQAWAKLERAKRRMLYTLRALGCPVRNRSEDGERGLAYQFLAPLPEGPKVLTGHDKGVITVNIAEADDATREAQRNKLHEPYRTLLGHFRHEIGHYYWMLLIEGGARLAACREVFGDESVDYAAALRKHYDTGAPAGWEEHYISAYAASHPWEDWAESWAHYMHMFDVLETAADNGLKLEPPRHDEPSLRQARADGGVSFDELLRNWFPVTFVLNNLNRSMGLPDGYPFVLSDEVIGKLRFIHATIREARQSRAPAAAANAAG
ncbi:MAG TPA: putative zinc-binding peptidase [Steroidobacteraceae bacterium]